MQVGARDLDVVAEDVVEAHLERLNAGALPLARFDLRDVLPAVLAQVAQLVQLGVEAGADGAAVGDVQRRLVGDGFQNQVGDVGQFVQAIVQRAQARGLLRIEAAFQRGNLFERAAQRQHIARTGRSQRHLGQQPLEIENAAQLLAQFGAQDGLLQQFAHRVEALLDFRAVHGGPQQALPQQPAAHAGEGLVEHRQHGGLLLRAAASAAKSGSTSSRLRTVTRVQHHGIGAVVISGPVQVVERGALRVAQVVENGAGGAHRRRPVGQSAAIQREQLEMIAQRAARRNRR